MKPMNIIRSVTLNIVGFSFLLSGFIYGFGYEDKLIEARLFFGIAVVAFACDSKKDEEEK